MMTIEDIQRKIDDKTVTAKDLNIFLESLPKSTSERVLRRGRLKAGNPIRPASHDPVLKAKAKLHKTGDNNPTKTPRGKAALRRRIKQNKKHSDRFAEAVEYLKVFKGKPLDECVAAASELTNVSNLRILLTRIMSSNPNNIDWYRDLYNKIK